MLSTGNSDGTNKTYEGSREHQDHQLFMRVVAVVLKLELRDRVSMMERHGVGDGNYIDVRDRLSTLDESGPQDTKPDTCLWDVLDAEMQLVKFFLCHLREKYPQRDW